MQRPLLLRPRFSCFLRRPKKGDRFELTNVVDTATLSIDTDRISILDITITRQVSAFIEVVGPGYEIEFYGGFTDNSAYYEGPKGINVQLTPDSFTYKTDNTEFFQSLFKGIISSVQVGYSEDGTKTLSIQAKDFTWGFAAKSPEYFAYPSKSSKRKFADTGTLKVSDIVKGICNEIGMSIGQILVEDEHVYTLKNPAHQEGLSDWTFLRQLAKDNQCRIWSEIEGNEYILNFVQFSKIRNTEDTIEFIWLDRTDEDYKFTTNDHIQDGDNVSELAKLKDNQVLISTLSLNVNTQLMNGQVVQVVTDFTTASGEHKEVLVSYDEDATDLIYYELDQQKVEAMVRNNSGEANRLSKMGPTGIPQGDWEKYYTEVRVPKHAFKAMDQPMMGVELNIAFVGNLNIKFMKSYAVYGIGKYQTRASGRLKYLVQGITHSWTPGDFVTELKMKA